MTLKEVSGAMHVLPLFADFFFLSISVEMPASFFSIYFIIMGIQL